MPLPPPGTVKHVVIMVQENHTTDNYFGGLAPWGANVVANWPVEPNPPTADPPHDRQHYYRWLHRYADWLRRPVNGEHAQFDTATVLPFYLYLALTGAFLENHCAGFGTNSTPNHLLIVGGQSPTLRNPPATAPPPSWDMPSLPGLAGDHGVSWRCYAARGYTGNGFYPIDFYPQLAGSPHVRHSADFITDVRAGGLPALSMPWHDSPLDEHPPADVREGMSAIWQAVAAVVQAGLWDDTAFLLTDDDWGGFDDHVKTPAVEYTPDNVQLAYGPRVPLLMCGGHVRPGIDSRWCSQVSIPKTALQLLGLPDLGVPRADTDHGLADLVDPAVANAPPAPTPPLHPLPPTPVAQASPAMAPTGAKVAACTRATWAGSDRPRPMRPSTCTRTRRRRPMRRGCARWARSRSGGVRRPSRPRPGRIARPARFSSACWPPRASACIASRRPRCYVRRAIRRPARPTCASAWPSTAPMATPWA